MDGNGVMNLGFHPVLRQVFDKLFPAFNLYDIGMEDLLHTLPTGWDNHLIIQIRQQSVIELGVLLTTAGYFFQELKMVIGHLGLNGA